MTFQPSLSAGEIGNPWRGQYLWQDIQLIPASYPWPTIDSYIRISWREIEPTEGNYDFTVIDRELSAAKARGGKLGLRIMAADSQRSIMVPDYLVPLMPNGYWSGGCSGCGAYVPDFNSPAFISRAEALNAALGKAFGNDPRLGWVETGFNGNFGEWTNSGLPVNPATGAAPPDMTDANKKAIIDSTVAAFPNTRILQAVEEDYPQDGFKYAMSLNTKIPIGARYDAIGGGGLSYWESYYGSILSDNWKKAPLITEYKGLAPGNGMAEEADDPTANGSAVGHHVAMLDGSYACSWTCYSSTDQAAIIDTMKRIGYRFNIDSLRMPGTVTEGANFTVTSTWSNIGITPAYNPWDVMLQLRNASGGVVWQSKSSLNLQTLLPTNASGTDSPISLTDTFNVPSGIASENYTLAVQVVDPTGYYAPLQLANYNRQTDGSYDIGQVYVSGT